jgi:hypothetical protein
LNIILYDVEAEDANGNVTKYKRCEKIDFDSAIDILNIYIPDFTDLF